MHKVTFSPGLANWVSTEVVGGLAENDLVVLNVDAPGLNDGASAIITDRSP